MSPVRARELCACVHSGIVARGSWGVKAGWYVCRCQSRNIAVMRGLDSANHEEARQKSKSHATFRMKSRVNCDLAARCVVDSSLAQMPR